MKKLLLISTNSIHLYNFYIVIKDLFDEIEIVTDKENLDYDFGKSKIHVINFSAKNIFRFFRNIRILNKITKEFKPNIIHSQQVGTNSFMAIRAAKKTKTPIVVTAWGSDILLTPTLGFFYKKMVLYIIKNANALTADARFVAEKMNELAKMQLDTTIVNFAAVSVFENCKKENIIYSNRQLTPLYRIDSIIKAFAMFLKENNNWKLIIAGKGEELSNLKKQTIELGISNNVEFAGWINKEQNYDFYKKSKFFISIPKSDGTSISLLEAMGAECIPIVSDIPANKEWINDGKNGIVVPNIHDDFISKAMEINIQEAIKINRELILNNATFEANKNSFNNIYLKLCKK